MQRGRYALYISQIVNSDKIRYCISKERSFELDIVEKYIQEHYDKNARSRLVEQCRKYTYIMKNRIPWQRRRYAHQAF